MKFTPRRVIRTYLTLTLLTTLSASLISGINTLFLANRRKDTAYAKQTVV